jgi:hypothetical protein
MDDLEPTVEEHMASFFAGRVQKGKGVVILYPTSLMCWMMVTLLPITAPVAAS